MATILDWLAWRGASLRAPAPADTANDFMDTQPCCRIGTSFATAKCAGSPDAPTQAPRCADAPGRSRRVGVHRGARARDLQQA